MKFSAISTIILTLFVAASAAAQDTPTPTSTTMMDAHYGRADNDHRFDSIKYPGSAWTVVGNLSPYEKGNILTLTHAEQGVSFHGYIEPYVSFTLGTDSKDYDWNNKDIEGVGARVIQSIGHYGSVRAGAQYVHEHRRLSGDSRNGMVYSADAYIQWGR